jgi:hypothetical protein
MTVIVAEPEARDLATELPPSADSGHSARLWRIS